MSNIAVISDDAVFIESYYGGSNVLFETVFKVFARINNEIIKRLILILFLKFCISLYSFISHMAVFGFF